MTGISSLGGYGLSGSYWYGYSRGASSAGIVEPVTPVKAATSLPASGVDPVATAAPRTSAPRTHQPESTQDMLLRHASDPVGMAARQRIQYIGDAQAEQPSASASGEVEDGQAAKSAAEVMEEGECQTCANRKYQDGSDDPGVSFKTPAHIAPENAAAVVRGHEMEHVTREQAKAEREDRKVTQQSVTLHTAICPECGDVYISGGTTRTTTAADNSEELAQQQREQQKRTPFEAVA